MDPIERRLLELGLVLPLPLRPPPGIKLPFAAVHVIGNRALISGHGPQNSDGSMLGLTGCLGDTLDVEQGYRAARMTALSILGSLQRTLGGLNRVRRWGRVFGMVRSAPGFQQQPEVINGFSDLILQIYGEERGMHARSAVGMFELPFDIPVEIEGEVEIDP